MADLEQRAAEHEAERHSSVWGWTVLGVLAVVVLARVVNRPDLCSAYVKSVILLAGINVTMAVSLNLINGVTGEFSIGHAGFMAVGAYTAAAVSVFCGTALEQAAGHGALDPSHPVLNLFLLPGAPAGLGVVLRAQTWFLVSLLAAGLAAALAGVVVGLPTLRLRGDYLAIATLGFGEIIRVVLLNTEVLGGASGFNGRPPFNLIPFYTNFINVYLTALVCILAVTTLKRSAPGRALLAVREDRIAAEAVGIDATRHKVLAFAVSAFFAGIAGGLLAHLQGSITPQMFGFMRSVEVIAMVVLGGSGSTTGCVLAALVLTALPERLRDVGAWRMVLYAEILVMMMLVRRQGLLGSREITSRDWFQWRWFLARRGLRGVWQTAGAALCGAFGGLRARLAPPGRDHFSAVLATAILLLPWLDLLAVALWRLPAGVPRGTVPVQIVSALTAQPGLLLSRWEAYRVVLAEVQLPLAVNAGLCIALLPLVLPWSGLAFGVAAGERRSAWVVAGAALLGVWHGGGTLLGGVHHPRFAVELAVALVLFLATLVWQRRETTREVRF
ncbi:MAG: branched-chain amino acid ABC transporter permease [Armatimonadetes bacterium]|nr:branched-chain amino acid ABC transporter permease [Armatimonadota bacterium]